MLLILTNSQDATADYLTSVLDQSDVAYLRLDTDTLTSQTSLAYSTSKAAICCGARWFVPQDISNVWYRRPERLKDNHLGETPEAKYALDEWAAAREGFFAHIPRTNWMNHPSSNAAASHKLEQLTTAHLLGFRIPETIVTQDEAALRAFYDRCHEQVVVKPMGNGYIERLDDAMDSLIYTNQVEKHHLDDLSDLSSCPTLFQEYIEKRSDVRITVVDGICHTVELLANDNAGRQRCDVRRNNMSDVIYRTIALPPDVKAQVKLLMEHYGLRFSAIDMVVSHDGMWHFLEINPNGQWAWLDLSAGQEIAASFVTSFSARH